MKLVVSKPCVRHYALIMGRRKGFATPTHAYRAIAKKQINIQIAKAVDSFYKEFPSSPIERVELAARMMANRWPSGEFGINWKARTAEINALAEKLRSEDESVF